MTLNLIACSQIPLFLNHNYLFVETAEQGMVFLLQFDV